MNSEALEIVKDNPGTLMRQATDVAGVCREIVMKTAIEIQKRKYVKVEGWQAIAVAHGCVASSKDVERVEGGYRAIGEIRRMSDAVLLATAEGFVGEDEATWFGGEAEVWDYQTRTRVKKLLPKRADYAIRAMCQTRAISRVCRSAFAHVVVLIDGNLSTTPAEEVPQGGFVDVEAEPTKQPATQKKAPAQSKSTTTAEVLPKAATLETLKWFVKQVEEAHLVDDVHGYLVADAKLLETESLDDTPLHVVPTSKQALAQLFNAVAQWKAKQAKPEAANGNEFTEEFWGVICPVPHAGQKRDDYLKHPDTIKSLYCDMKGGDNDAGKRLYGFVNHYVPQPWKGRDGKERPPNATDVNWRTALDAFQEWAEAHGENNDN